MKETLKKVMQVAGVIAAIAVALYCVALMIAIVVAIVAIIVAIIKGLKTPRIPAPHERDVIETTAFVILPSRELTKR